MFWRFWYLPTQSRPDLSRGKWFLEDCTVYVPGWFLSWRCNFPLPLLKVSDNQIFTKLKIKWLKSTHKICLVIKRCMARKWWIGNETKDVFFSNFDSAVWKALKWRKVIKWKKVSWRQENESERTHPKFKLRAVALNADDVIVFISLFSRGLFPYD